MAGCSGSSSSSNSGAETYVDVIRYIDTLGRMADGDGNMVFHNTFAASNYSLIDEETLNPRPTYWAAVLWAKLMGPKVLQVKDLPKEDDLAVYAHCTPATASGSSARVTYAVLNSSATKSHQFRTGADQVEVYALSSDALDSKTAMLNGTVLEAADDGVVGELPGKPATGPVTVGPASVSFIVSEAGAGACG